jgi:hypothetical protein
MFHRLGVLLVSVYNGGHSPMYEAFLKHYTGDRFDAKNAGLERGELNQLAVNNQRKI